MSQKKQVYVIFCGVIQGDQFLIRLLRILLPGIDFKEREFDDEWRDKKTYSGRQKNKKIIKEIIIYKSITLFEKILYSI